MAIEVNAPQAICSRCGMRYSRRKGYFPVSYAVLYKGIGHTHVCRDCIDSMYNDFLSQCHDASLAVRQMCRKLDLYWSDRVYRQVERKSTTRSMMTQYIAKINTASYAGKSYDDTLLEEGTLWEFGTGVNSDTEKIKEPEESAAAEDISSEDINISDDVIAFWGTGLEPEMYIALEQRRSYWMSRFPDGVDVDIGTEAIIRQICSLELDINRDRAAGRAVDKSVNALNTLLGSASLKPAQKKDDTNAKIQDTPMGVWLYRYENLRPLPEISDERKDSPIKRYIFTWMGHLCKMLGVKNGYTRMYEEEIARLKVEKPEYEDEDEESLLIDSYSEPHSESDSP